MGPATNMVRHDLTRRIDAIGWGLLFLMTGMLLLIPGLPDGTWLVGLGVLLLGINATKVAIGLAPEWFSVILGTTALVGGLGAMVGIALPWFAWLLILCGLAIIAGQMVRQR